VQIEFQGDPGGDDRCCEPVGGQGLKNCAPQKACACVEGGGGGGWECVQDTWETMKLVSACPV
jgi:hypothetical protein